MIDIQHVAVLVAIYYLFALGLDLVLGHAGFLSLGHGGIFAVGSYSLAVATVYLGWGFLSGLCVATIMGAVCGRLMGSLMCRMQGDNFAVCTLALHMGLVGTLNTMTVVGGSGGIRGIPAWPASFAFGTRGWLYCAFTSVVAILVGSLMARLLRARFGLVLHAQRDEPALAIAIGRDINAARRTAAMASGMLTATAGGLYAGYTRFVDPVMFGVPESLMIVTAVFIGGPGSPVGPFVGAAAVVVVPELLRYAPLPDAASGKAEQVLFGLGLMLWLRFKRSQAGSLLQ